MRLGWACVTPCLCLQLLVSTKYTASALAEETNHPVTHFASDTGRYSARIAALQLQHDPGAILHLLSRWPRAQDNFGAHAGT